MLPLSHLQSFLRKISLVELHLNQPTTIYRQPQLTLSSSSSMTNKHKNKNDSSATAKPMVTSTANGHTSSPASVPMLGLLAGGYAKGKQALMALINELRSDGASLEVE